MRFKYLALLTALAFILFPVSSAHAQISFGIQIGGGYPDAPPPEPVCPYGYYSYPPYDCAPVGYYGPQWFNDGVFIGAGPWYHYGWGYRDGWDHERWEHERGEWGRGGWSHDRGWGGGRGYIGNGFHGGGGGFRGHDGGFHGGGGGGFRGHGGGFRGGRGR